MSETKRASLEQLLEFANAVREAGGGNPLDALMPAVPEDVSKCLIARNLNFNCTVGSVRPGNDAYGLRRDGWVMAVTDKGIRDRIAERLNLETADSVDLAYQYDDARSPQDMHKIPVYGVLLPPEIGQVAADFDHAWQEVTYDGSDNAHIDQESDAELIKMVDESVKEAQGIASFVNPDGSIVI